jgi:trigger factor
MRERFKDAIKDEVVEKALQKAVFDKIEKDKMKIASQPSIEKVDFEEGTDLKAEVSVEVFPTVELPELENIEVEIPAAELKIPEYDEQKQIDMLLDGNKKQAPVSGRGIIENDYVSLKYQAKLLQTKKMTPQKQTYFVVSEKEEFEIIDLYKDILGKNKDDHFTIVRTYPADHQKKLWAGKEIEFHITILSVMEMVKPELNETFLKSIGFQDEASFKDKWKEEYEKYHQNVAEEKKLKFIFDKLVTAISFPVPAASVEDEAEHIVSHYEEQYHFKMDMKNPILMEPVKKEAEKSVRLSLILDAVKKKFNLEITSDELEAEYKTVAEANRVPLAEVRKYFMNKEQSHQLKDRLLKMKVSNLLKEKVKVIEV